MIAALYVQKGGCYFGLNNIDPWDEDRDARKYGGPYPVIAHPPCARWSQLAVWAEHMYGRNAGEDGGCFTHALDSVRKYGGVLEHPAYTNAWRTYGLVRPIRGEWTPTECGGWVTELSQCMYGHPSRKRTWLYINTVCKPPAIDWREVPPVGGYKTVEQLSRKVRNATPTAFRDLLICIAQRSRCT